MLVGLRLTAVLNHDKKRRERGIEKRGGTASVAPDGIYGPYGHLGLSDRPLDDLK